VLQDSISPVDNLVWVGHNICGFDIPFLFLRAMVNDIRIPWLPGRNVKPWTPHVCDTLYEVAGTEFKGASLKNVAKVLGIQNPYHDEKDVTNNGELVKSEEGRAQLAQWCANDVRMTREIYRKLTGALPRDQEG
jgi:hypothetical protein